MSLLSGHTQGIFKVLFSLVSVRTGLNNCSVSLKNDQTLDIYKLKDTPIFSKAIDVVIPSNIPAGQYVVIITDLLNSLVSDQSSVFFITEMSVTAQSSQKIGALSISMLLGLDYSTYSNSLSTYNFELSSNLAVVFGIDATQISVLSVYPGSVALSVVVVSTGISILESSFTPSSDLPSSAPVMPTYGTVPSFDMQQVMSSKLQTILNEAAGNPLSALYSGSLTSYFLSVSSSQIIVIKCDDSTYREVCPAKVSSPFLEITYVIIIIAFVAAILIGGLCYWVIKIRNKDFNERVKSEIETRRSSRLSRLSRQRPSMVSMFPTENGVDELDVMRQEYLQSKYEESTQDGRRYSVTSVCFSFSFYSSLIDAHVSC